MFEKLIALCTLEFTVMSRNKGSWIPVLLLFGLTIVLFGFSLGQQSEILSAASPAILWVAILFSMISMGESVFRSDLEEGWLDQLKISQTPLWWVMLAKATALWVILSLSFIVLLPCVVFWLNIPVNLLIHMGYLYILTAPALILIMLLGVSLTIGLPQPGLLLGLILLPLYIPILILGQSALSAMQMLEPFRFQLSILTATSIISILCLPYLIELILKQTSHD